MDTKNRTLGAVLGLTNADLYTVPYNWDSTISSILITNITTSPCTVSLDWYDSLSATYYSIVKKAIIPANGVVQITDVLYLGQGDLIRGLASAAASINVSLRVEEAFAPTQF